MQLSTYALKHHLQDSALLDWVQLHGKAWLIEHPKMMHQLYPDDEHPIYNTRVNHGPVAGMPQSESCTQNALNTFYEHVIHVCAQNNIPSPQRVNYSVFASSPSLIDEQHNTYVMVESVYLQGNIKIDDQQVTLRVSPTLLLSQPLAKLLFEDMTKMPVKCNDVPFCRWVPVYLNVSGKASVLTHASRSTKYDAMRFQWCQSVLHHWTPEAHKQPQLQSIGGIILHTKSIYNSKFYVYEPPTLVLSVKGTLQYKPYTWMNALKWAMTVREHGNEWDPVTNTTHIELCSPVSSCLDDMWKPFVEWLEKERSDMCLVYKIGAVQRMKAWRHGVRTFHDVWSMQKQLKDLNIHPLSMQIIWANHKDNPEKKMVVPRRLKKQNHIQTIQQTKTQPYFVIDFETIRSDWIFMVATVYHNPLTNETKVFTEKMHNLTDGEQIAMLHRWITTMQTYAPLQHTLLFHWSSAEPTFLKTLFGKHPRFLDILQSKHPNTAQIFTTPNALQWSDLCEVFLKEPITVPGCFDFQLKHIIKALVRIQILPEKHLWAEDGLQDGLTAMNMAEQAYRECTYQAFDEIQKYNEADVLVLHDLIMCLLWKMV